MDEAIAATRQATLPAALAEPTVPVKGSWISLLFLANIGLWLAIYAPLQVLLPEQVQSLHDHITKSNVVPSGTDAVLLSVVMGVGAIAGLFANPVVVAPLAAGVVLGLMSRGSTGIDEQLRCPLCTSRLGHGHGRVDGPPRPFGILIAFTKTI